ncbi:hypothetical protein BZG36_03942 [Bifiguratus adelaidae]|uniref:Mso1 N-terminal domain-containing protein n=1 Tax=Bifiguratus adelaidae TaxID=1938954 RepID=A0A261XZW0_9FUNG|nr:hypothetical protein BZG36_03942 [Bifiguratus adelaidae]
MHSQFHLPSGKASKTTGKLWNSILTAGQSALDEVRGVKYPESDDEDENGESYISRTLRKYYERKGDPVPAWLDNQGYGNRYVNPSAFQSSYSQGQSRRPQTLPADFASNMRGSDRPKRLWERTPGTEEPPTLRDNVDLISRTRRLGLNDDDAVVLVDRPRTGPIPDRPSTFAGPNHPSMRTSRPMSSSAGGYGYSRPVSDGLDARGRPSSSTNPGYRPMGPRDVPRRTDPPPPPRGYR